MRVKSTYNLARQLKGRSVPARNDAASVAVRLTVSTVSQVTAVLTDNNKVVKVQNWSPGQKDQSRSRECQGRTLGT